LSCDEQREADENRQPRRLHTFGNRVGTPARAVQPGDTRGCAVRQEGHLGRDLGEYDTRHGKSGQGDRTEMADHGRVDQQVERLGREHAQRRDGKREQAPKRRHGLPPG
jgi:hypothetical protein